ncbi:MAG: pyridoxamine 5'-phosphate oxidase family protein, partial [Chloroflexota bacterium]
MNEKISNPMTDRPEMEGYGIQPIGSGENLIPWVEVSQKLTRARNYWLATTRPDGRPHAMPVWGVWLDEAFYFGTGADTVKARNLVHN